MIRQRLGPHRVHFKPGRLVSAGGVNDGSFLEHDRSNSKCYEDCDKHPSDIEVTLHGSPWSFHEMVRYYTRFGCASDPLSCSTMRRIITPFRVAASIAAMSAILSSSAFAHEIPNDVTVQAFVKPQGDRLHLLVRVPLKAMRDLLFPERGGYLDLERVAPILPDAAVLWISDFIELYEGNTRLPKPKVVATRISLESDRSFADYDAALAHVTGPPLSPD